MKYYLSAESLCTEMIEFQAIRCASYSCRLNFLLYYIFTEVIYSRKRTVVMTLSTIYLTAVYWYIITFINYSLLLRCQYTSLYLLLGYLFYVLVPLTTIFQLQFAKCQMICDYEFGRMWIKPPKYMRKETQKTQSADQDRNRRTPEYDAKIPVAT